MIAATIFAPAYRVGNKPASSRRELPTLHAFMSRKPARSVEVVLMDR
ncbi:hypothetical protein J2794_002646 [Paraburkholderia terricola]|nr:hypothetical protein [Paraburkholderia terricola]MDR6446534.1 hypothetical protein [Paraburkholderia terricola]